jgi:predicted ester cyclase
MANEDHKALVRRFWEDVFNQKHLERADAYVAQDYLDHGALPGQGPGLEGAKRQRWALYFAAVPDLHARIDDMVAEGDRISVRFTVTGTQVGELMGVPPTGRHFDVGAMCIYRIAGGKVAEQWEQMDSLGLMRQLGAIPAPAQQPA